MQNIESLRLEIEARLPQALDLLRQMVGINSWTRNPEGIQRLADLTRKAFAPLGFRAESVPSPEPLYGSHLFLTRDGTDGPTLGLVSHLDTVFSPEEEQRNGFQWMPEGDRIYGPGTEDIKGGTVMIWLVLSALQAVSPDRFSRTRWVIALNAAEEELSPDFGGHCLDRLGPEALAALVFEAEGRRGDFLGLVRARKGRGTFALQAIGRSSHAGVDHPRGANAITQLARSVLQAESLTRHAEGLTVNVGRIRGGEGLNRVPQEAVAEGEFRALDTRTYAEARRRLLELGGPGEVASVADGFRTEVTLEITSETPPWPVNPPTESLLRLWVEAGTTLGLAVEGEIRGGLSDGNHLWEGVPTLDGLGPSGGNAHCSERNSAGTKLPEYVLPGSFPPKALLNAVAIGRLLDSRRNGGIGAGATRPTPPLPARVPDA